MEVDEDKDGWEHAWIGSLAPPNEYIECGEGRAVNNQPGQKWAAAFELSGSPQLSFPNTQKPTVADWSGNEPVTIKGRSYTEFSPSEQAHIYFGANGANEDRWHINSLTDYRLV